MFLFLRLLLAHLLADFPLQFSGLFKLKTENIRGVILHGSIFGLLAVLFSMPYITYPKMGIFLIILWVLHIFTDWLKIKLIKISKKDGIGLFIFDQILHVAAIAIVILFKFPAVTPDKFFIWDLYANNKFVLYCIFYIFATFTATVLIYYLKKSFIKGSVVFPQKARYYEIFERALIVTLMVLPGHFYIIAIIAAGIKLLVCISRKFETKEYDFSLFNFMFSFSIAFFSGIVLRLI